MLSTFEGAIGPGNTEWVQKGDGEMVLQVLRVDVGLDKETILAGRPARPSPGHPARAFTPFIST